MGVLGLGAKSSAAQYIKKAVKVTGAGRSRFRALSVKEAHNQAYIITGGLRFPQGPLVLSLARFFPWLS